MHLVIGFIQIMLAYFLMSLYRLLHVDWVGRQIVRLSCAAFTAGASLDDAAIEVILILGDDGIRLLKFESRLRGERSTATLLLKLVEVAKNL